MPKKKILSKNTLNVVYTDDFTETLCLSSAECWKRFRLLVDFFSNNPFCGIVSIQICDNRDVPIMTFINDMAL